MGKFAKRRNHMQYIRITSENIDSEHICCAMSGKQSVAKKAWLKERFAEGLVFYRSEERGKCFIEYIPAENAWVPIDAPGYLYINCLWIAGSMKGHGYSSDLLGECIRDAKAQGRQGICILSAEGRKREFLSDPKYLAYKGFTVADTSDCGITLMYLAADAVGGKANVQGMRQTSGNQGGRLRSLLYGSVSVHLLLGAPGGGGRRRARHSPENRPDRRQRNRAESPRPGDHLRTVPGREVRDSRHSV